MRATHKKILREMLALPTAPFAEHHVLQYVERFCRKRPTLTVTHDAAGNLLGHLKIGRRRLRRPVCITAHLDHPGFVSSDVLPRGRIGAYWRGGVPKEYFVGAAVRFYVDGRWVRGRVESVRTAIKQGRERVHTAVIEVRGEVPPQSIGMWDFPDPRIRGRRIYARGCDDLAGAAAMLCAIDELTRRPSIGEAYFLFTRAEEVGFVGALAAARAKTIPPSCFVVAMETSAQRRHVRVGDGPILRVGDRASTFTPEVTSFCHRIARELAAADPTFVYQRQLMDGGTCESSAYCTLGYEATGMCLALGNYHNVDERRRRLASEYVDLTDFAHVVRWFVELACTKHRYTGRDEPLADQLQQLERDYAGLLRASRRGPR